MTQGVTQGPQLSAPNTRSPELKRLRPDLDWLGQRDIFVQVSHTHLKFVVYMTCTKSLGVCELLHALLTCIGAMQP